ncbi:MULTISPECIES: hypothetical protein [Neisseria]|uniref:hypothetical protein n=1 Tax=Neisseria TaxID=482 RepID=UPI0010718895|nr:MULTISPECIES: hypothetical protein [Neisseria]MBF0803646.1 hypothetical protein [Neisseria sp. 19428wB4_WF04]TFU43641.1 hypothetical protein E4T99_04655 [Neisseria sp. WF04]
MRRQTITAGWARWSAGCDAAAFTLSGFIGQTGGRFGRLRPSGLRPSESIAAVADAVEALRKNQPGIRRLKKRQTDAAYLQGRRQICVEKYTN